MQSSIMNKVIRQRVISMQRRGFGGHGHGTVNRNAPYGGFEPPHVADIHKNLGEAMATVMWFWIMYRAKEDGLAVLGIQHPWDAHGGHGDHHGHGHSHGQLKWEKKVGERPVPVEE